MFKRSAAVCLAVASVLALAQPTSLSPLAARPNGMRSAESTHHVFINATIHPEPGVVWEPGFIEIRDGWIVSAGEGGAVPEGATVHDLEGEHVYSAFIDPFVEVDAPRPSDDQPGRHWNASVNPRRSALDGGGLGSGEAESHRKLGFGAAAIVPSGGVFRGMGAVVSLGERPVDSSAERVEVYRDRVFHSLAYQTSGWTTRSYPTSTPGAVALMRQTLMDADWQARHAPTLEGSNPANALTPLEDRRVPLLFHCEHELAHFLSADIAGETERPAVLVGNGMEFKWLDGIAGLGLPMIVPLRFPAKPDVSSVGRAESVELETMMTWEQAPTNPRRLAERLGRAGVDLALTASDLPRGRKFHDEVRVAIEHGLSERDALAMLTTAPSRIAGVDDQLGTIAPGKRANLLVASGPVFEKGSDLLEIWIDGRRHELKARPGPGFDGAWRVWVGPEEAPFFEMRFDITGSPGRTKITGTETWSPEGEDEPHSSDARNVEVEGERISFLLDDEDDEQKTYIMSAVLIAPDRMLGTGVATDDSTFQWAARRIEGDDDPGAERAGSGNRKDKDSREQAPPLPGYPFGPYAVAYEPVAEMLLVNNATIWTSSERGTFERGWILIYEGRILRVEPAPTPEFLLDGSNVEIVVLDASGMHVTPGLIDAHSHTSLFRFGVNEAGQAVTAEVRIGDALDPSHINWYRQLAMGVTTVNSLHGSANPIGGQNQIHKVRWGARSPAEMRLTGGRPGIKFALGENVKQSNWNIRNNERTRYPQSRMGVETIIRDRFEAARRYAIEQAHWYTEAVAADLERRTGSRPRRLTPPPHPSRAAVNYGLRVLQDRFDGEDLSFAPESSRIDLELEALAEILAGERLVHCHSYRQDEILMLCRVAEDFGFQIGSFQHGLEVYKVPEAVRDHAIGASLFSDWWMYKMEVMDAIPYAGPLQTEAGVNTSYNSDSDELARRMNLEAAKAYKYARPGSGFDQAEALKFVTINAAMQLGVDQSVGSLEEGKDADFVIWTDNPLSTRAVANRVFIDGREYFSLEQDRLHRERISSERQRLIQKIVASPDRKRGDGAPPDRDGTDEQPMVDTPPNRRGVLASWIDAGFHPDDMRPGDCGCGIINHAIYYEQTER